MTSRNQMVSLKKSYFEKPFRIFFGKISSMFTKIRPLMGANGAGKTTLLKFKAKEYTNEIAPDKNIF